MKQCSTGRYAIVDLKAFLFCKQWYEKEKYFIVSYSYKKGWEPEVLLWLVKPHLHNAVFYFFSSFLKMFYDFIVVSLLNDCMTKRSSPAKLLHSFIRAFLENSGARLDSFRMRICLLALSIAQSWRLCFFSALCFSHKVTS